MEFWNDIVTDISWNILIELTRKYNVIVIGGWAIYLYTNAIKSKDIDIIVDFETLSRLKSDYNIKKNESLQKYETKIENISVDIYVPHYSRFPIPIGEITSNTTKIEGIVIAKSEILLILKQAAELERKDSVKGMKDRVDILNLLLNSDFDYARYKALVKKYHLEDFISRLKTIISISDREYIYLGIDNPKERKSQKKRILSKLK